MKCSICRRRLGRRRYKWDIYTRNGIYHLTLCSKCDLELLGYNRKKLAKLIKRIYGHHLKPYDILHIDTLVVKIVA